METSFNTSQIAKNVYKLCLEPLPLPSLLLQAFLRVPYLVLFFLSCMSTIYPMLWNSVKLQCLWTTPNSFQLSKLRTTAKTYKKTWTNCKFDRHAVSGLSFIDKKCKAQHITWKITPITTTYQLSSNLEQTDSQRDLGVWVQNNLIWNKQVDYHSAKANKLLAYIRSTLYIHNTAVRGILYLTLVPPHLGHGTQIWPSQLVFKFRN